MSIKLFVKVIYILFSAFSFLCLRLYAFDSAVKHMQIACETQLVRDGWIHVHRIYAFSLPWSRDHNTLNCRRLDSIALELQITQRGGRHLPLAILRSSPIPGSTHIQSASYTDPKSARDICLPFILVETYTTSVIKMQSLWIKKTDAVTRNCKKCFKCACNASL